MNLAKADFFTNHCKNFTFWLSQKISFFTFLQSTLHKNDVQTPCLNSVMARNCVHCVGQKDQIQHKQFDANQLNQVKIINQYVVVDSNIV